MNGKFICQSGLPLYMLQKVVMLYDELPQSQEMV
jgi:hypothetical protein